MKCLARRTDLRTGGTPYPLVWPGQGVVYSQRLSALRTKSRLNVAMTSELYRSMTLRSWQTTLKLLEIARDVDRG
jgi:hypothetical protein